MTVTSTMSRTDVVLVAMRRELQERRNSIDAAADVAEITLTIRLQPGTSWIRATQYAEERIMRARSQRPTG